MSAKKTKKPGVSWKVVTFDSDDYVIHRELFDRRKDAERAFREQARFWHVVMLRVEYHRVKEHCPE